MSSEQAIKIIRLTQLLLQLVIGCLGVLHA